MKTNVEGHNETKAAGKEEMGKNKDKQQKINRFCNSNQEAF